MIVGCLKKDVNYIVTKGSYDGLIIEGQRLRFEYDAGFTFGAYQLFGPPTDNQDTLFGLKPMNHVRYFHSEESLLDAVRGVEVRLDKDWAMSRYEEYQTG